MSSPRTCKIIIGTWVSIERDDQHFSLEFVQTGRLKSVHLLLYRQMDCRFFLAIVCDIGDIMPAQLILARVRSQLVSVILQCSVIELEPTLRALRGPADVSVTATSFKTKEIF